MKGKWWAMTMMSVIALGSAVPRSAQACGGLFCNQSQPVNQAAERIVFANNGDGTVTAVIEIQYQGPSENFSWLLPISSVPMGDEIAVASKSSFDRLQTATNPQYSLTTRVEGVCDVPPPCTTCGGGGASGFPGLATGGSGGTANLPGSGVTVEASGVVGSFEWTVISLDQSLANPADAAVTWLTDNGYDVPEGSPGLLGPYLEDGLYLLALRLQKGADTGSIRPIALTYDATRPMIPIKLTSVAANDDMGVMVWVLGDGQAIPVNYNALELNEARINWFSANSTYNSVVIAAADEASGQGFVTEYAQPGSQLDQVVWGTFDEDTWTLVSSNAEAQGQGLITNAMSYYAGSDGFWDVMREQVTLPEGVTFEQQQACPFCNYGPYQFVAADFVAALESEVIAPARLVQELIDAHDKVTRLYTTMSAGEMTVDPLFSFNASLDDVSNIHTAERIIECGPGYYESTAPWRIELPQGGVIRGGPEDLGIWPAEFAELPANRRILRIGETGDGQVLEDNGASIDDAIETYSASVPTPPQNSPSGTGSNSPPMGGPSPIGTPGEQPPGSYTPGGGSGCGCAVAESQARFGLGFGLLGLLALGARRREGRKQS